MLSQKHIIFTLSIRRPSNKELCKVAFAPIYPPISWQFTLVLGIARLASLFFFANWPWLVPTGLGEEKQFTELFLKSNNHNV
jgi:hypothetical protein